MTHQLSICCAAAMACQDNDAVFCSLIAVHRECVNNPRQIVTSMAILIPRVVHTHMMDNTLSSYITVHHDRNEQTMTTSGSNQHDRDTTCSHGASFAKCSSPTNKAMIRVLCTSWKWKSQFIATLRRHSRNMIVSICEGNSPVKSISGDQLI